MSQLIGQEGYVKAVFTCWV